MRTDKPRKSTMNHSIHDSGHQSTPSAPETAPGFHLSDSKQSRICCSRFRGGSSVAVATVYALALLIFITACQSTDRGPGANALPKTTWPVQQLNKSSPRKVTQQPRQKSTPGQRMPTRKQAEPAPPLIPITESRGIVVLVNTQSQFIVADFSFNPVPTPGQRLAIFRNGQRVGEARTSEFARGSLVAADILTGEARLDDEVRAE